MNSQNTKSGASVSFGDVQSVLDAVPVGVLVADTSGRVSMANTAASSLLGFREPISPGVSLASLFRPFGQTGRGGEGPPRLEGEWELGENRVMVTTHELATEGEARGTVYVLWSASADYTTEVQLREARLLARDLGAIIDSSFDGIYITDRRGTTLRVNSAYERISGLKPEELLGRNVEELVAEGILPNCITPTVVRRQGPVTTTQTFKTGKTAIITGSPILDETGTVERVVTNVRDITELQRLKEALEQSRKLSKRYEQRVQELQSLESCTKGIVAHSREMQHILHLARVVAQVDSTVLIQGESGVGKEVIARLIHNTSPRSKGPFVKINCGGIPETLLESELFGYEPGAFTGARREGKAGLMEAASGGTVLLDEIAELPQALQAKLLQVLQDYEFTPVGGTRSVRANIRVIAATNKDLLQEVGLGRFREDLYYRLNVVPIYVPPLRHRRDDIAPLVLGCLAEVCERYGKEKEMTSEALNLLIEYDWPGNAREIRNIIERLAVTSQSKVIRPEDLPVPLRDKRKLGTAVTVTRIVPLKEAVAEVERLLVAQALEKAGSTHKAAKMLQVSQSTLVRKSHRYLAPSPGQ